MMKTLPKHRPRAGLSAAELAIALSTLIALAAVVSRPVVGLVRQSRFQALVEEFRTLEDGLLAYYTDVGTLKPLEDIAGFGEAPEEAAVRHFLTGDGRPGWDGPYLAAVRAHSEHGGTWDIDVLNADQAVISLGTREELGGTFAAILETVNAALDGDGDLTRGAVWGDARGVCLGFNYERP